MVRFLNIWCEKSIVMKYFFYLIILGSISISCSKQQKTESMPPLNLPVVEARSEMIPNRINFVGQTQALNSYKIEPRISGYLKSINFVGGSEVKKGEVIFTIDAAAYEANYSQERANLAAAQAQLVQAETNYNRSVPLARINAISQSQFDAATAQLKSAKESVAAAEAVLRNANLNLGYTVITAPDDGIIAQTNASVGDYVGVGTQYSVLTTVSNNEKVTVNLSLPTSKYFKIASEQGLVSNKNDSLLSDIQLKLSDGYVYPKKGEYQYTAQNVDNQSGSIVFNVSFDNSEGLLKSGQFARVSANVGKTQERVIIPQKCVSEVQGVFNVWILGNDNVVEFRKVSVGDTWGEMWIIDDGLKAGEKVITEGFSKLRNGMKVNPLPSNKTTFTEK